MFLSLCITIVCIYIWTHIKAENEGDMTKWLVDQTSTFCQCLADSSKCVPTSVMAMASESDLDFIYASSEGSARLVDGVIMGSDTHSGSDIRADAWELAVTASETVYDVVSEGSGWLTNTFLGGVQ